jgi:hypothetical protein
MERGLAPIGACRPPRAGVEDSQNPRLPVVPACLRQGREIPDRSADTEFQEVSMFKPRGFIPAPGTNPKVFSQGDELIINDQLTTTQRAKCGYPIVGHDAGACILTKNAADAGELRRHGRVQGRQPDCPGSRPLPVAAAQSAVLAVTGGTGRFDRTAGTVAVSSTKNFKILSFALK